MTKPQPIPSEPEMNYHQMAAYVKEKHHLDDNELWNWLVDTFDITNGDSGFLPTWSTNYWYELAPDEVRDLLQVFAQEFKEQVDAEGNINCIFSW